MSQILQMIQSHILEVVLLLLLVVESVLLVIVMIRQKKLFQALKKLSAGTPATSTPPTTPITPIKPPTSTMSIPLATPAASPSKAVVPPKPVSQREQVLDAIRSIREVDDKSLASTMEELTAYFIKSVNGDYLQSLASKDYYRLLDLRHSPQARVVVIGDNHCDFYALVAVLLKLSVSDYDYFERATFVCLGDYLDRGAALFETQLLLKRLKEILGDRFILLRGNHELVDFDEATHRFKSRVRPAQTSECLNKYCGHNTEFLRQFARFHSTLPTYVYLKTSHKNVLLTHASIARDKYLSMYHIDAQSGEIVFEPAVPTESRLAMRNGILKDMIWGDPRDCDEKMQFDSRFEYGRKQFERFATRNHVNMLLRSHEEVAEGYKKFFDGSVVTLFSTGGKANAQTGYPNVEPVFAVLCDGELYIESCFVYDVSAASGPIAMNLFTNNRQNSSSVRDTLGDEFRCTWDKSQQIIAAFKAARAAFPSED